jgi:hypothetical protein
LSREREREIAGDGKQHTILVRWVDRAERQRKWAYHVIPGWTPNVTALEDQVLNSPEGDNFQEIEKKSIESGKDSSNEQGQSELIKMKIHVESSFTNDKGQSSIQDNLAVETHTLQGSEGQLRKPIELFGVDVIATPSLGHNAVNPRTDDLLALQTEQQLEHSADEKGSTLSSLNPEPVITVSKSRFTNCSLVRCEIPPLSRFKERLREMLEIERFLNKDYHFAYLLNDLDAPMPPDKTREDMLLELFRKAYRHHNFKEDRCLFDEICRPIGRYIILKKEDEAEEGFQEELKEFETESSSRYFDYDRGAWVYMSYVPYNLGQCERTSGPSHVEDGGGDAAQRSSRLSRNLGDRSSPERYQRSRAGSNSHNVGTDP